LSRKVEIEWPDFNTTVTADLLDEENPEICETFWQALPIQTIFAASMSAGEMLKIPIPITLPEAPPEKCVLFTDQPPGTVISYGMGVLLLRYGTVAEPFMKPRVMMIPKEEQDKLWNVARRLRDAYFFTKEVNVATLRRKE